MGAKARQQPNENLPPTTEKEEHMAMLLYVSRPELKMDEISEMVGVNVNTLRTWKHRRNWDKGLAEVREMLAKRNPTKEEPMVIAAVETREQIAKGYETNLQNAAKKFGEHVVKMLPEEMIEEAPKLDSADKMFGRRLKLDVEESAGSGNHISLTFLSAAAEGSVRIISTIPQRMELPAPEESASTEIP